MHKLSIVIQIGIFELNEFVLKWNMKIFVFCYIYIILKENNSIFYDF